MTFRTLSLLILLIIPLTATSGQDPTAPTLVLKDLHGRTVRLNDYRGKIVLINFWATWCPPCRAEIPYLVKLQREYGKNGLQVIGITYPPQTKREVREFIRSRKVNYPIVIGSKETKERFFKGETLPVTIVIDRKGTIREVIEGILLPEEFEQKIKPLLE